MRSLPAKIITPNISSIDSRCIIKVLKQVVHQLRTTGKVSKIKLDKAKEILDLNIKQAGSKMPPDTLTALKIGSEAINFIIRLRSCSIQFRNQMLPSETIRNGQNFPEENLNKLRESPIGEK